jgi:hypothetical protein
MDLSAAAPTAAKTSPILNKVTMKTLRVVKKKRQVLCPLRQYSHMVIIFKSNAMMDHMLLNQPIITLLQMYDEICKACMI